VLHKSYAILLRSMYNSRALHKSTQNYDLLGGILFLPFACSTPFPQLGCKSR
jgi:hypothetical protein